jgi:F420-dependent methylenetetrahydromethanopterin dehydrogenase
MPRFILFACVAAHIALSAVSVLTAQEGTSYDDNALRLEGHVGDVRIVRGAQGTVLGKVGVFRGIDVAKLVTSSEKATIEAKNFAHDYGPGTWLTSLGIATLGAAIGVSRIHDVNSSITTGLMLAGTGLIVYGGSRLESAYNALSRSVWWYNRDLKR